MTPLASFHDITLQVKIEKSINSMILGNANRIKQMLMNLVKNAIEDMDMGGTVTISLKNVQDKIQVTVRDEGRGIEKDKIPDLFKPFYTTKAGGTGLGLQLVKQIIEEHEGNIHVNSILNEGTSFVVELPLAVESFKQTRKIIQIENEMYL